jgi:hypothetical protein
MELSKPLGWKARVLYTLIEKRGTSLKDFPHLAGFRTRISELKLKYNVKLISTPIPDMDIYGSPYYYKHHSLPADEVNNAIEVYNLINKSK